MSRLLDPLGFRVAQVVAPAGSGKSRLLTHVALGYLGPVAWCGSPDPVPHSERAVAEWLWDGLAPALGRAGTPEAGIQGIVDAVSPDGPVVLIVVDDVQLLESSGAESALAELVERLPPRLRVLLASRVDMALDLSRLRVSGHVVDIGHEDLRFRTWEVEELFRDVYRDPLIPEDVAALAWRTAGWAAYLQLFHLATANKSQAERRRVLATLGQHSRLVREYLTRHVLAVLPSDLQDFLIRTSVLRRPTGALCDELLGWPDGSQHMLNELERRQLLTERIDEESYRYHSVLLTHLEARLVEALGAEPARREHQRAAVLLEREGHTEEAAAAYAKAEDWGGVARMLGQPDTVAAGTSGSWLEALPPTVVENDALLLVARAQRDLARGSLLAAVSTLRTAQERATSSAVADRCRNELERYAAWAEPEKSFGDDWMAVLRQATQHHPDQALRKAADLPEVTGRFAEGGTAFLAGDMPHAYRLLRGVADHPDAAPALVAGSRLMAVVAGALSGRAPALGDLERLRDEVEQVRIPWLERMTRAILEAAGPQARDVFENLSDACQREGDRWGEALVAFIAGYCSLSTGDVAVPSFARATTIFEGLGAAILEGAACAYWALAANAAGDADQALHSARRSVGIASRVGGPGLAGLSALALSRALGDDRELARARELLQPLGSWDWYRSLGLTGGQSGPGSPEGQPGQRPTATSDRHGPASSTPIRLRCLGGFSLVIGGRSIDESVAKPKERELLHLLAMAPGEAFHREFLVEALWPDADPDAGRHRLHVAVSSLRRLLGIDPDGGAQLLTREGDSYRLALPSDADVDVWRMESLLRRGESAKANRQGMSEQQALAEALAVYDGPLLPSDGPVEWVVNRRTAIQGAAANAAARLSGLRFEDGQYESAAEAARAGVAIDRYRDELWELLIEAAQRAGHQAEAGQARRSYAAVLHELEV